MVAALALGIASGIAGIAGASASKSSAKDIAAANRYAADLQQDQYDQTREDAMPWLEAGADGLNALVETSGVKATPEELKKWRGKRKKLRGRLDTLNDLEERKAQLEGEIEAANAPPEGSVWDFEYGYWREPREGETPSTQAPDYTPSPDVTAAREELANIEKRLGNFGDVQGKIKNLTTKIKKGKNSPDAPRDPYDIDSDPLMGETRDTAKWKDSAFNPGKPRDPYAVEKDSLRPDRRETAEWEDSEFYRGETRDPYAFGKDKLMGPHRRTADFKDSIYAKNTTGNENTNIDMNLRDVSSWEDSPLHREKPGGSFEESPGYSYRLKESQKALERRGAASGMRFSGEMLKALQDDAQGVASEEYDAWWNRNRTEKLDHDFNYNNWRDNRDSDETWNYNQRKDRRDREFDDQDRRLDGYDKWRAKRDDDDIWNYNMRLDSYNRGINERDASDRAYKDWNVLKDSNENWNYTTDLDSYNRGLGEKDRYDAGRINWLNERRFNDDWNYGLGIDSYNRAQGEVADYWNRNASLAGFGEAATARTSAAGTTAATNSGNYLVNAANANAAGTAGAVSAINNGLNNLTTVWGYQNGLNGPAVAGGGNALAPTTSTRPVARPF